MFTRLLRIIRLQSLQTGLTTAGLLLAGHALAQPTIQSLAPARNAPAARATSVTVQFSEPLRTGSQQALRVYSAQAGGRLAGVATLSGNQLSFTPGTRFRAGEKLWATVDTLVRSAAGRALARPQVWQFSAGGGGNGVFGGGSSSLINTSGRLLLSGDVDGNGHLDVLTLNDAQSDRDGQLALRLNSGRGVLVAVPDQPLTRRAMAATLADVDEDHDLDLVTLEQPTDGSSGFYNVYANDGQGRFGGAGSSNGALGGLAGRGLGLADLNGDGHLDMFFSCNMSGSVGGGAVGVRLNNGRGAFPVQWTYARTGLSTEATVAAADIDNDGDLDVVASHNAVQSVIPFFNGGVAGLLPAPAVAVGGNAQALDLADLDLDGDLDLLCTNFSYDGATVGIRFNNGQGSFGGGFNYPIGSINSTMPCVATNDLDGDGDLDLLLGNDQDRRVLVRLNNGRGEFRDGTPLTLTQPPHALVLADLDDDDDVDVLGLGHSQVQWQLNNGTALPTISLAAFSPAPNRPAVRTTTVDATFSGPVGSAPANQLHVYGRYSGRQLGTTTASGSTLTFSAARPFQAGELLTAIIPTGVRGSAGLPLARPAVWQFTAAAGGSGLFTPGFSQTYGYYFYPRRMRLADIDGDADLDIVTAFSIGSPTLMPPLLVCLNNGTGQFGSPVPLLPGNVQAQGFELADFDQDGDVDFVGITNTAVVNGAIRGEGTIWLNDGRGVFSRKEALSNSFGTSFAVGDVDGDGDLDVVDGSVHFNDGEGSFSSSGNLAGSSSYYAIRTCALADLDNDADLDVLTFDESYGACWFRNDGTGAFSTRIYLRGNPIDDFQIQDLDGDGDIDLISPSSSSVLFNDGNGIFTLGPAFATNGIFQPSSDLVGDIDGDGDIDALTASGSLELRLYTNNGRGTFSEAAPLFSTNRGLSANRTASGDLDNDGDLDLAVVYQESQGVSGWRVFLNRNALPVASATAAQQLSVWPVPSAAGAVLQVRVPGHTGAAVATLHTLTGQVVRVVPFSGAALALPTAGLPAGSYLLSIEGAVPGRLVRRVVLE